MRGRIYRGSQLDGIDVKTSIFKDEEVKIASVFAFRWVTVCQHRVYADKDMLDETLLSPFYCWKTEAQEVKCWSVTVPD